MKTMWAAAGARGGGAELSEQEKWNNIAWNLPAGQALRAKIESVMSKLRPEQAALEEKVSKREGVRQAHDRSVAVVEEAVATLSGLESRKTEMDAILGEVRQQLEDIKKALLKLTKADLDQLRRMPDPPIPIRRTLEMVHLILNSSSVNVGQRVDYERQVRRTLAKADLIASILNFDVALLSQNPHIAEAVEQNYLGGVASQGGGEDSVAEDGSPAEKGQGPGSQSGKHFGPLADLHKAEVQARSTGSPKSPAPSRVRVTSTSPPKEATTSFAASFAQSGGFGGSLPGGGAPGSLGAFFGAPAPKSSASFNGNAATPPERSGGALPTLRRSSSSSPSSPSSSPASSAPLTSSPPGGGLKRLPSSGSASSASTS